jgi:phosphate uptake regulator
VVSLYSPTVLDTLGIENIRECIEFRLVGRHIERIADHATIISEMLLRVIDDIDDDDSQLLIKMGGLVVKQLEFAIDSLLHKKYELAEKTISLRNEFRRLEDTAINRLSTYKQGQFIASMRMAIESYRRVSEYSAGIAELSINILVKPPY